MAHLNFNCFDTFVNMPINVRYIKFYRSVDWCFTANVVWGVTTGGAKMCRVMSKNMVVPGEIKFII